MNPIKATLAAFNAATAPTKAGIIAALCGALGVLGGFVLYIVFTHIFEQGEAAAKLAGIAGGLAASVVIAWFGHRLWETIETGEVTLNLQSRKTLISAVALVVVFELSASAFEDLMRALSGDFGAIERVAANIAGRDTGAADTSLSIGEVAALLPLMRAELARLPPPRDPARCTTCTPSPVLRLVSLMPREIRYRIFAPELQPSDETLKQLFFGPGSLFRGFDTSCRIEPVSSRDLVWNRFGNTSQPDAARIAACRNELMTQSDDSRLLMLQQALAGIQNRHDLYDNTSFTQTVEGREAVIAASVRQRLKTGRANCDALRAAVPEAPSCLAAVKTPGVDPGIGKLSPIQEVRALNRELLAAAFPGHVNPLPVFWGDLALLVVIWTTAAIVLGVYLSATLFFEDEGKSPLATVGWRLLVALLAVAFASVLAGVALVLSRLLPFLWQLMTAPETLAPFSALEFVPLIVQTLAGLGVPGWLSLPLIVIGLFVAWAQGKPGQGSDGANLAGVALLGLLLTSVWPVMGGMIGVVIIVAGAWLVPAVGLSLLAPYLKPAVKLPQWWGAVALAGGLALAFWVATMLGGTDWVSRGVMGGAGLLAAATGILILRQVSVAELWPLLALTISLTLVGGNAAFQQLTFAGALKELHPVSQARYGNEQPSQLEMLYYLRVVRPQQEAETIPPAFQAPPANDELKEALRLELALTGSIGFWLTISLLVAWSLKLGPQRDTHEKAGAKTASHA